MSQSRMRSQAESQPHMAAVEEEGAGGPQVTQDRMCDVFEMFVERINALEATVATQQELLRHLLRSRQRSQDPQVSSPAVAPWYRDYSGISRFDLRKAFDGCPDEVIVAHVVPRGVPHPDLLDGACKHMLDAWKKGAPDSPAVQHILATLKDDAPRVLQLLKDAPEDGTVFVWEAGLQPPLGTDVPLEGRHMRMPVMRWLAETWALGTAWQRPPCPARPQTSRILAVTSSYVVLHNLARDKADGGIQDVLCDLSELLVRGLNCASWEGNRVALHTCEMIVEPFVSACLHGDPPSMVAQWRALPDHARWLVRCYTGESTSRWGFLHMHMPVIRAILGAEYHASDGAAADE